MRVVNALERGDTESLQEAVQRAFVIIDKILLEPDMEKRKEEILILRNVLQDSINSPHGKKNYILERKHVESYFHPFALRLQKLSGFE
jgi:hypothetical protein